MTERISFSPSAERATVRDLRDFLAEVFASLRTRWADAPVAGRRMPRAEVALDFRAADRDAGPDRPAAIDLTDGDVRIVPTAGRPFPTGLGRAWLAEHSVPLALGPRTVLRLSPAGGGRIRCRARMCDT